MLKENQLAIITDQGEVEALVPKVEGKTVANGGPWGFDFEDKTIVSYNDNKE